MPNSFLLAAAAPGTVYDTTTEKLGMILFADQDLPGVLVKRDEITGWIGSMEKYASSGRGPVADRALWLQSHDGGLYAVDRVTRPDLANCKPFSSLDPRRHSTGAHGRDRTG